MSSPIDDLGAPGRKADLRRRMRMVTGTIDDRSLRSIMLWNRLAALDAYRSASVVMAFSGIRGEPDTDGLHERITADGKVLVLPAIEGERIVPRRVGDGLRPGALGVREPTGDSVDPADIDLVVVPGMAFSPDGARLGRGGGHYDRFLAGLPERCAAIGVCFAEQLVDELPCEPHDRIVDAVVSDDLPE
jgi:5-formyltetrahydrofolate cyclo-ligase